MAWMFSDTPLATGRSWLRDCEQSESFGRLCEWFASRIFTVVGDFPHLTLWKEKMMSTQTCGTTNEQKQSCEVPKEEQKQADEKKSCCG